MSIVSNFSPLEYALRYAAKGWRVFPLQQGKLPAIRQWVIEASCDASRIHQWDASYLGGCNYGFAPGEDDCIVVIDVDNKNDKSGDRQLAAYMLENNLSLPDTFTVRTPSGGRHLYFKASKELRSRVNWLPGVDVRGVGGYVVAAGSIMQGGGKYTVEVDLDAAPCPQWLEEELSRSNTYELAEPITEAQLKAANFIPDTAEKAAFARQELSRLRAEPGERNYKLFQWGCEACKMGLTFGKAIELFNAEGCTFIEYDPEQDSIEIARTLESAYKAKKALFGSNSVEINRAICAQYFEPVTDEQKAQFAPNNDGEDKTIYHSWEGFDWNDLANRPYPMRKWFIKNWLLDDEGFSVLYSGRGGTGKSSLMFDLIYSLATGEPWCGMPVERKCKCMYVTCEDSINELTRRVSDRAKVYGKPVPSGMLRIMPRMGANNLFCTSDRQGRLIEQPAYGELFKRCAEFFGNDGGVLILDTLSDFYAASEIERGQVSAFVKKFLNRFGRALGVTVIMIAHPPKYESANLQGFSGSTAWEGSFRCRWELNYAKNDTVDGKVELILAKSNVAKAGQKITLMNVEGIHHVVSLKECLDELKEQLYWMISDAWEDGQPYGLTARSSRPIQKCGVVDGTTGKPVPESEIEEAVCALRAEGRVVLERDARSKGLRPADTL